MEGERSEKAVFNKDIAGRQVLGVRGTGEDSVAWRTADLKLTPGGTYMFRFKTQADGSGTIISGLENVNRDFAAAPEWTTHNFAFRVPDGVAEPTVLHLGHWNLKGEALFDSAELFPVQAVHNRVWGALELGEGERIVSGNLHGHTPTGLARVNDSSHAFQTGCAFQLQPLVLRARFRGSLQTNPSVADEQRRSPPQCQLSYRRHAASKRQQGRAKLDPSGFSAQDGGH